MASKEEKTHKISYVAEDSPAYYAGLEPGDIILEINGHKLKDIFDYHYYSDDADPALVVEDAEGVLHTVTVEKDEGEDLGVMFDNGLLDDYRSCSNACIFCFIDQMPKGMRDTLYFKDDDTRLSFLQGNYVTLTNMKDEDLDRLIAYRMSPINISVQTTNPELRVKMLHNRFAGNILDRIKKLYDAQLEMNGQIVLCRGINDGAELERSIRDLLQFYPYMNTLSVVPVGLSKYREGLYPLEPFTKEDAVGVLSIIHKWQHIAMERYGHPFVQAGDEWYLLAEEDLPPAENYDGYTQLENGVGMLRLLMDEFAEALADSHEHLLRHRHLSIATGKLASPFIARMCQDLEQKYPKVQVDVHTIRNDFFGERITVSGLITGQDLIAQLRGKDLGERLLLPCNMLRSGEDVFLDDIHVSQVEQALHTQVDIVESSGQDLVDAILHHQVNHTRDM